MNELHLFAGAGGGILGGQLLGHKTICAVEFEPYAQAVLVAGQNDGCFPPFPIWDDVRTFDGKPWRGIVDVVAGGFPCQDISTAGKGAGISGTKSGLWKEFKRIIWETRPKFAWIENSPALVVRGLETVVSDLSEMGYDCRWGVFSSASVGGEHVRERLFILAYSNSAQCEGGRISSRIHQENTITSYTRRGKDKPKVDRALNGVAFGAHRLKAIGNGQDPYVVQRAWKILMGEIS